MRIARLILVGSIAALTVAMAPAPAKNSNASNANAQKVEETPVAQGCRAYQQAPDGQWVQLSCQEAGPVAQALTPHKSATRSPDEETR